MRPNSCCFTEWNMEIDTSLQATSISLIHFLVHHRWQWFVKSGGSWDKYFRAHLVQDDLTWSCTGFLYILIVLRRSDLSSVSCFFFRMETLLGNCLAVQNFWSQSIHHADPQFGWHTVEEEMTGSLLTFPAIPNESRH